MKFGGTSVADAERLKRAAQRIVAQREHGKRVVAVLSAADIPGPNDCGSIVHDDPILCDGEIRYLGQPVFAVIAETRDIARRAAAKAKDVLTIEAAPPVITPQQAHAKVVLIGMYVPPNYGPDYTQKFHGMYGTLSSDLHVPLVPFLLAGIENKPNMFQADQIHPTQQAQPLLLDNVWPAVKPLLRTTSTR